jgi:hypothetical protein
VGNGWLDPTAAWAIASGQLLGVSADYANHLLTRPNSEFTGRDHQRVEVTVRSATAPDYYSSLIWVRQQSTNSGYICFISNISGGPALAYARADSGVLHDVDGATPIPGLVGGTRAILTVEANGSTVTMSVASGTAPTVPLATLVKTDATYPSGSVGVSPLTPTDVVYRFRAEYFG